MLINCVFYNNIYLIVKDKFIIIIYINIYLYNNNIQHFYFRYIIIINDINEIFL